MAGYLDPSRLTPGVLDGAAEHAFRYGACGALAIAMHDALGWPIAAVTDAHNVHEGRACMGSSLHWAVLRPDGLLVDVLGAHEPGALVAEFEADADDGEAAWGLASRAHALEEYRDAKGEPIPVALAARFVDAVVERARTVDVRRVDAPDAPGIG